MPTKKDQVNLAVTAEAREELHTFAANTTGTLGRRVTLNEALRIALAIAGCANPTALKRAQTAVNVDLRTGAGR